MNGLLLELFAVAPLTISGLFDGSLVLEDRVGMAEPHAHADRGGAGAASPCSARRIRETFVAQG
jgi:hypothetical protein